VIDFTGQAAVVTGAGRGLGRLYALDLARRGAAVVVNDLGGSMRGAGADSGVADEVVDEIKGAGGTAIASYDSVDSPAGGQAIIDAAVDAFGRLDAAFNNASAGPLPTPLADIDPADFDLGIATNIRGTFLGMKFQIPAMLRSGGGTIVNMASIAGLNGTANLAAYVAGKAGIIGLTKVAALDYADQGIRVNVVAPGPILTYHLEAAGPQAQQGAAMSTPMRRVGRPAEVAQVVLWLCSEQSSFVTGTVVPIDGGQAAGNKPQHMYRQGQPMEAPAAGG